MAETDVRRCASPVAHTNGTTLAARLRDRAAFALRRPRPSAPLMQAQALRGPCGGLRQVPELPAGARPEVHHRVGLARERDGSLMDLPWPARVDAITGWQPRRRQRFGRP